MNCKYRINQNIFSIMHPDLFAATEREKDGTSNNLILALPAKRDGRQVVPHEITSGTACHF